MRTWRGAQTRRQRGEAIVISEAAFGSPSISEPQILQFGGTVDLTRFEKGMKRSEKDPTILSISTEDKGSRSLSSVGASIPPETVVLTDLRKATKPTSPSRNNGGVYNNPSG